MAASAASTANFAGFSFAVVLCATDRGKWPSGICSIPLGHFPRSVAQRTTAKEKPAKFAVEAAEAALHFERLYRIQGFSECFQNSWQVVRMNRNLPSRVQSLLCR